MLASPHAKAETHFKAMAKYAAAVAAAVLLHDKCTIHFSKVLHLKHVRVWLGVVTKLVQRAFLPNQQPRITSLWGAMFSFWLWHNSRWFKSSNIASQNLPYFYGLKKLRIISQCRMLQLKMKRGMTLTSVIVSKRAITRHFSPEVHGLHDRGIIIFLPWHSKVNWVKLSLLRVCSVMFS